MKHQNERRLADGRVVSVHRNGGVRKICGCSRRLWPKCAHPWHFAFTWKRRPYRLSLDKHVGKHIETKGEAEKLADVLRTKIRAGTFEVPDDAPPTITEREPALTFTEFADTWRKRKGHTLVNARDNAYRLGTICRFVLPESAPPRTLGDTDVRAITTNDIDAFRDFRKAAGLSSVTINHDLRLLRKMFNWGIRSGLLARTPFKIGTEAAISLEREAPRNKRLEGDDDESRLLAAANDHLRGLLIGILDTACRPGELLSLQWRDVSLKRKEIRICAEKEKTRRERIIPISSRLMGVLEMRRLDPSGEPYGPAAYVFGNKVGEQVKSVHTAWVNACAAAGLKNFQLRDLRHEAGSRFDEAGMPIIYVSNMLGHASLTTTTRYLNVRRRGLHLAMQAYEKSRLAIPLQAETETETEPAIEQDQPADEKSYVS